ncbi:hypothetical protein [Schwartzia succinivorans]|jgi:CRISPR-associated protein Csx10|uniref:CRISPR-associated protein Csx10 n=1 Tax=Schwartzia succinivorans DSM 10502 TaxID=1123243 RepID=A0A1M4ZB28_9FIRM|nr:hypothetical protein [Schwartzia succinivorans]SHF14972.1 CRISPR-associated protein Csx10 [Schwartzia succinivorans DSM 10502]
MNMKKINVSVKLLSPVVLSRLNNTTVMTETHDNISGSILRGVLVSQYIDAKKLGKEAHNDADFCSLFFDKLRFTDANPVERNTGERSFVLPLSLMALKAGMKPENADDPVVQDMLIDTTPRKNYKAKRGYASVKEGAIYKASVKKDIRLHMSRGESEERLLGSSLNGGVYNYEALSAGQRFEAAIYGDSDSLQKLMNTVQLTGKTVTAHIGRSKYTQYGKCSLTFSDIEEVQLPAVSGEEICLRLDSPLIPFDAEWTDAAKVFEDIFGEYGLHVEAVFASSAEIENFVGIWHMNRPKETALATGSVVRLSGIRDEQTIEKLTELCFNGAGRRTEEGFGQLRVWEPSDAYTIGDAETGEDMDALKSIPQAVKDIAGAVAERKIEERLKHIAGRDAGSIRGRINGKTHFFAELLQMLDAAKTESAKETALIKRFEELLKNQPQYANGRPFKSHLDSVDVNGKRLEDAMFDEQFYVQHVRLQSDELRSFMDCIGEKLELAKDAYYYAYWHQFFRSARKAAATKKGDE